jgi:hypothetical protein
MSINSGVKLVVKNVATNQLVSEPKIILTAPTNALALPARLVKGMSARAVVLGF